MQINVRQAFGNAAKTLPDKRQNGPFTDWRTDDDESSHYFYQQLGYEGFKNVDWARVNPRCMIKDDIRALVDQMEFITLI